MKNSLFSLAALFLFCSMTLLAGDVLAQESRWYSKSGGELIFSGGDMGDAALITPGGNIELMETDPVVRFSAFFHLQTQFHYDFNESVGIYTGFGVRNIGWITKFSGSETLGSFRLKQRSYSFGIPLALKFGDVSDGFYVAVGGEAELFFAYKQKLFLNDQKYKSSDWFSNKVNLFNPSVFLDLVFAQGGYIRFKYYPTDFLKDDKQKFSVGENTYQWVPEKSQLFSISIGTVLRTKDFTTRSAPVNKTAYIF